MMNYVDIFNRRRFKEEYRQKGRDSMNINGLKQDYSFLFSGLNGAKNSNNLFAST